MANRFGRRPTAASHTIRLIKIGERIYPCYYYGGIYWYAPLFLTSVYQWRD
jgi:hypothetical protein